ncbi:MAG: hypothetical protein H6605_04085 [Flavobacteriales bacterium]|nr:hypothetical protein [Flavobacteriales bacterium]
MKNRFIYIFFICTLFWTCNKENESTATSDGIEEKLTANLNTMHDAVVVYDRVLKQSGDSIAAFDSLRMWLGRQSTVKDGGFDNFERLEVEFMNGLKSSISFIPVNQNGEHLTRGGSGQGALTAFQFSSNSSKNIKNKKALVLIPYPDEFQYNLTSIFTLKKEMEDGLRDLEADMEYGSNVTLDDLNRLGDYGFIILDVHGTINGFFLAYLKKTYAMTDVWIPEDVIASAFNIHSIPADKIANGEIEIGMDIYTNDDNEVKFNFNILITEKYIRQLNVDLSDAVLFGNHCYSGYTADGPNKNNLPEAWRSLGVATYYGYAFDNQKSMAVDNIFCKDMEKQLVQGLVIDGDSTGSAHLNSDGTTPFYESGSGYVSPRGKLLTENYTTVPSPSIFLVQFFDKNYEFERCKMGTLTDSRDGQEYKTVTIGNQTWMAENLRYLPFVHTNKEFSDAYDNTSPAYGVYGYNGSDVNVAKSKPEYGVYGVIYNWWAATANQGSSSSNPSGIKGACPSNWHLPSQEEWRELAKATGLSSESGSKLKSKTLWDSPSTSTNEFCFSAVPGGDRLESTGNFYDLGVIGYNWTTTEALPLIAFSAGFSSKGPAFGSGQSSMGRGYTCRCVKD